MTPYIHRRTFGTGDHQILAIHCSLAHSGALRGFAAAMGEAFTIHAFDLPNHGKSGDWDGTGDMHDVATAMALRVMDDLGPAPLDVVGHSFGATVALRIAVEAPERIRRAVLFEPVYFAPALADDPAFARAHRAVDATYETAITEGRFEEATRLFNRQWAGAGTWADLPDKTRAYMTERIMFVRHSAPFLIQDSGGLMAPGRLARADMPILLARGACSDWAVPINAALARRLPNASEVSIPEAGHMAPVTHPAEFADVTGAFLGL